MDRSARFMRWAWLPLGVLGLAIALAGVLGAPAAPLPSLFIWWLELALIGAPALLVTWYSARAFLDAGSRGVLLLGCGVLAFGLSVNLGRLAVSERLEGLMTVYDLGLLLCALFHLFGSIAMRRRVETTQRPFWLMVGCVATAATVAVFVLLVARADTPPWFVVGSGGTPLRQAVLGGSGLLLVVSAVLLRGQAVSPSQRVFVRWYALGMLLLAIGQVGMLLQKDGGGLLSALVFAALALGALYLAAAWLRVPAEADGEPAPLSLAHAPHDWWLRYGLAVVFVAVAALVRLVFFGMLGTATPYVHVMPAVVLAALYGGAGPALLALALSMLLADLFWIDPINELGFQTQVELAGAVVYVLSSLIVIAVVLMLQRARLQLQRTESQRQLAEERARDAEAARDAAERLRSTEERYRALFDSVDQGACMCEIVCDDMGLPADFRFLEVNPAFAAVTGLPGQIAGQSAAALRAARPENWLVPYARVALRQRVAAVRGFHP